MQDNLLLKLLKLQFPFTVKSVTVKFTSTVTLPYKETALASAVVILDAPKKSMASVFNFVNSRRSGLEIIRLLAVLKWNGELSTGGSVTLGFNDILLV